MGNKHLQRAQKVKNDEFYTRLEDIELEIPHYKQHFKDKVVYCNCDNPEFSKFWTFFHQHFAKYGLKKLIATYYDKTQFTKKWIYVGGNDSDPAVADISDLGSHGDFRSAACIQLLKEADIVVTNPPFSLAQSFVAYMQKYEKPFIFIAPMTLITSKQCCELICNNQLFVGVNAHKTRRRNRMHFTTPFGTIEDASTWWYSTLKADIEKPWFESDAHYDPQLYAQYENYDAIQCDSKHPVPLDTDKLICVPLSFLRDLNTNQFEVVGIAKNGLGIVGEQKGKDPVIKDEDGNLCTVFAKLLIRRKW